VLQRELADCKQELASLKQKEVQWKELKMEMEQDFKKKEVELSTARRDALNAIESQKRQQEQLTDAIHKNNLYKIETEELLKQIDLADAKVREKDDDLRLARAEYDRKVKSVEERILSSINKREDRDIYELRRDFQIQLEKLTDEIKVLKEDEAYHTKKIEKLEAENKSLKLERDNNRQVKALESQVDDLKGQLYEAQQAAIRTTGSNY